MTEENRELLLFLLLVKYVIKNDGPHNAELQEA